MTRYKRDGCDVMDGLSHVAEADDEMWAIIICNALNDMQDRSALGRCEVQERLFDEAVKKVHMRRHEGDEMTCSCGLRWDARDADPH